MFSFGSIRCVCIALEQESHNRAIILEITRSIVGYEGPGLLQGRRQFVRDGMLNKGKVRLVLFNDAYLITKKGWCVHEQITIARIGTVQQVR
jgi:hypothetical protein